jgi:hypothetical protein
MSAPMSKETSKAVAVIVGSLLLLAVLLVIAHHFHPH